MNFLKLFETILSGCDYIIITETFHGFDKIVSTAAEVEFIISFYRLFIFWKVDINTSLGAC